MRMKFLFLLFFVAAISLPFAFGIVAPHGTSDLSLVESTLVPSKVALLEPFTLTLDSPSVVRLGDVAAIRLTVTIDTVGNVSIIANESAVMPVTNVSDAFDSYNVIAETRIDLPRLYILPAKLICQPIRAGQSITFMWSVRADAVGEYEGTAWFFLRFVPKGDDAESAGQDSGPEGELAVAAIPFNLRVVSFFGMKGSIARIIGTVGLFVGILIALPLFLDHLFRSKG